MGGKVDWRLKSASGKRGPILRYKKVWQACFDQNTSSHFLVPSGFPPQTSKNEKKNKTARDFQLQRRMCRFVVYENPHCGCRWLQIYQQCRPNAGFSQCEDFGTGKVEYDAPDERESLQCPVHDLRGWYDLNYVRK